MNKKLLTSLIVLSILSIGAAQVQADVLGSYNKAKSKLQQVDKKISDTTNAAANAKANKIAAVQKEKTNALATIQKQIDAKNAEISKVKNATMLETERKIRLKKLNSELSSLKNKYSTTEKLYNKRLEALK